MNRIEVFEATGPTSGSWVKVKIGAKSDGKIVAVEGTLAYEAGAFPGSPVRIGSLCMFAPYDIENLHLESYDVIVNKPKVAAYRAPGSPAAMFAGESAIDELAENLGMDPIELRLLNSAKVGSRQANGVPYKDPIGNVACLEAIANSPHAGSELGEAPAGKKRGRGIASGFWPGAGLKSSVYAAVNSDGTVTLVEGNPDIGGTRASLAMQLAETLGVPYEAIRPSVGDTDTVGYNDVTGGSRTTLTGGIAVYQVGLDIQRQLIERAATIWGVPADQVTYEKGTLVGPEAEQRMSFADLAGRLNRTGAPVIGRATVSPKTVGGAFATHLVDVEVDV
jgi:CO/xanthine dehydrogenase Mo-binding subunit